MRKFLPPLILWGLGLLAGMSFAAGDSAVGAFTTAMSMVGILIALA